MPRRHRTSLSPPPAFTLIEVLVVLAIAGVLLGMIVPRMAAGMSGRQVRSAAQQFKLELEAARQFAITRQTRSRVEIDVEAGTYRASFQPAPLGEPHRFEPVRADATRQGRMPRDVRFASVRVQPRLDELRDTTAITFEPTGEADDVAIELTDGQQTWTLRVSGPTGRISLTAGRAAEPFPDRVDLDL